MFRKQLVIFIFLISIFYLKASGQIVSFPQDSTTWHYIIEDFSGPLPVYNYSDYSIVGDTIINNISYIRVNTTYWQVEYLYRIDTLGRVWVRYLDPTFFMCTDTNEILAYDFSLNVNDSIFIHNCYGDSFLCVVGISDSALTSQGNRKEIKFASQVQFTCANSDTLIWIEGIGAYNDLFYNLNFFRPGLVCEALYYFTYIDLYGQTIYLITKLNELDKKYNVYIDKENILHSNNTIKRISIYDGVGRNIINEFLNRNEVQIDFNNLSVGVNILTIYINESVLSLKIVRFE